MQYSGIKFHVPLFQNIGNINGSDELPLFALIPQVVDEISIPVIAAGGIADARGVVAAFSLGAKGVQLGIRFCSANLVSGVRKGRRNSIS